MENEINRATKIKQMCEVCDEEGNFSPGRIKIIGMPGNRERPVGQCPACEKFFCSKHAEKTVADLNQEELSQFGVILRKSGSQPYLLSCPLDLRIPLGDPNRGSIVVVSEEVERLSWVGDDEETERPGQAGDFFSRLKGFFGRKRPPA